MNVCEKKWIESYRMYIEKGEMKERYMLVNLMIYFALL